MNPVPSEVENLWPRGLKFGQGEHLPQAFLTSAAVRLEVLCQWTVSVFPLTSLHYLIFQWLFLFWSADALFFPRLSSLLQVDLVFLKSCPSHLPWKSVAVSRGSVDSPSSLALSSWTPKSVWISSKHLIVCSTPRA